MLAAHDRVNVYDARCKTKVLWRLRRRVSENTLLLGSSVDRGGPLPRVGASQFGRAQNRSECQKILKGQRGAAGTSSAVYRPLRGLREGSFTLESPLGYLSRTTSSSISF